MIVLITSLRDIVTESIVGIIVVFMVLASLLVVFSLLGRIINYMSRLRMKREGRNVKGVKRMNSYEVAAVSYALHLYLSELHDEESNIITLKRVDNKYSPWNSKVYGLNEQ
ncbi:MAG: hypothetical protein CR968_01930 [Flavobacteriia bacterium]|nr:MAG: hypothetical protein CR968_01930 [Flavobacteriia bacterium]